ncbi:hypothetical protein DPMN_105351 [Dreissena polymorpha]|uniref:Uncharacterized protein n=1 Tax=Dreissena polymorpha TaxID=45954 RepID=A0A9D4HBN1_DREPO|nr:hypothetical protein DPMN_105351 [Dreissena polymorpha]
MTRILIKVDRIGCWLMHLQAVSDCLSLFAAANEQPRRNAPRRLSRFPDGCHVVRRSNQCRTRLSSDLVIWQTLMKSPKNTVGLIGGSGMTEKMQTFQPYLHM